MNASFRIGDSLPTTTRGLHSPSEFPVSPAALGPCLLVFLLWLVPTCTAWGQQPAANDYQSLVPRQLLGLVHAPEVHRELTMSPGQVAKLESLFAEIDGEWFRARNLPADKQMAVLTKLENRVWQWFRQYGSEAQVKRLKQLDHRARGIRMLLGVELARQLKLDKEQLSQLASLARTSDEAAAKLRMATMKNEVTEELKSSVLQASQAEQEAVKSVLRAEQMAQLQQIIGQPFDATALKRIYPMAPELIPVKDWINSNPLTLAELRGKVVILHFYAFQCHNCHANFDHYRRWHEEFGDDVVVLGIQTPETSLERDPDAVASAASERDLDFPILVDLESSNWKAWSNTMWPTVYVIDKNGYIRQWWQGELNWNGATGDQKIQNIVRELLQEHQDA